MKDTMDLISALHSYTNNAEYYNLSDQIINDPKVFDELVDCFNSSDPRLVQRSSNVLVRCVQLKPTLIEPYLDDIIDRLQEDAMDATKRNILRLLQFCIIPEKHYGKLAEHCFKWLDSAVVPVAIRIFSMSVLLNIVKVIPELKDELRIMIEDHFPYGSAGFKSRGKKVLKEIQKI